MRQVKNDWSLPISNLFLVKLKMSYYIFSRVLSWLNHYFKELKLNTFLPVHLLGHQKFTFRNFIFNWYNWNQCQSLLVNVIAQIILILKIIRKIQFLIGLLRIWWAATTLRYTSEKLFSISKSSWFYGTTFSKKI